MEKWTIPTGKNNL